MAEVDSLGKPTSAPWTYYHDIDKEGRMMRGGVDLMGQPAWMRTGPESHLFELYGEHPSGVEATGPEEEYQPLPQTPTTGYMEGWVDPLKAGGIYEKRRSYSGKGEWRPGTPEEWRRPSSWTGRDTIHPRDVPSLTDRQLITGDEGPPAPYQYIADKEADGVGARERGKRGYRQEKVRGLARSIPFLFGEEHPREDIRSKDPFYMPHPSTPDVGYGPSVSPMSPNQVKQIMAEMLRAKEEQRKQSLPR